MSKISPPSPSKAKRRKKPRSATVYSLDEERGARLARRALGGDLGAAIAWLHRNDAQWREAIDAVREAEGR